MLKLKGVIGVISSQPISDVQLSNGRDMEYGSVIRKAKHSRALPIYRHINLWLGDLRGIYGGDKSVGRVPRGSQAETGATPLGTGAWPMNDWKPRKKAPFSVELEKITERAARDKRQKHGEGRKQREKARHHTPADQMTLTGKWNWILDRFSIRIPPWNAPHEWLCQLHQIRPVFNVTQGYHLPS